MSTNRGIAGDDNVSVIVGDDDMIMFTNHG